MPYKYKNIANKICASSAFSLLICSTIFAEQNTSKHYLNFVNKQAAQDYQGIRLDAVEIIGSQLIGLNSKGQYLYGKQMAGSIFNGQLSNGNIIPLRVEKLWQHQHLEDKDIFYYQVSYKTKTQWQPLCGHDANKKPIGAIVMRGYWDYSSKTETGGQHYDDNAVFTFACKDQGIAHCVIAGYKPWKKVLQCDDNKQCELISLADHHQACTRMLRADFCGDGSSYTKKGVDINYYDQLNIRYDADDWFFEAEWTINGARCINTPRLTTPRNQCLKKRQLKNCGDHNNFSNKILIFSEHR